jgi:hypothetical protein
VKILFPCKSLFKFELGCGDMENRIIIKSMKRQFYHVVLHEQVENGDVVNNNLNANQID